MSEFIKFKILGIKKSTISSRFLKIIFYLFAMK